MLVLCVGTMWSQGAGGILRRKDVYIKDKELHFLSPPPPHFFFLSVSQDARCLRGMIGRLPPGTGPPMQLSLRKAWLLSVWASLLLGYSVEE